MKFKVKELAILLVIGCMFPLLINNTFNFSVDQTTFNNLKNSSVYDGGIQIDALTTTNTTYSGNWTWAVSQPWCYDDNGVYIIEDLTINASSTPTGSGIYIGNSHDVNFRIQNCTIVDLVAISSYGAGINLINCSRGVIFNNTITNTNWIACGIQLQGYNCYNITIERNVVTSIGRHGILTYGGNNIYIINNTVTSIQYQGIYLFHGCKNSTIAYNHVENANVHYDSTIDAGIRLLDIDNDNNKIFNNTVLACRRGMYLRDSSNNSIHLLKEKNSVKKHLLLLSL